MNDDQRTIDDWSEIGVHPPGIGTDVRIGCPFCLKDRKPAHQHEKDFVMAGNRETGMCHHCGVRVNIRTKGHQGPMFQAPSERKKTYTRPTPYSGDDVATYEAFEKQLLDRGIDPTLANDYGINFIQTTQGPTMVIPYYNVDGELINHKYRTLDKKFWMDKDAERGFFNIQNVEGADVIVIVEGEMDVFALDQAGWPHAISVPNGAPPPGARNYASMFDYLDTAKETLEWASRIILAVDNDEPGVALREELARRLPHPERVAHLYWPDGIKDANEYLVAYGRDALKAAVGTAQVRPASGVFTPADLWNDLKHDLLYGGDTGTRIGFPSIDAIYRPTRGHLTVLTGHAASGKSTVLDNFVVRLATLQNWPVAYFSPEMQPLRLHLRNLIEIYLNKPLVIREGVRAEDLASIEEVEKAKDFLGELISFINPEDVGQTPNLETILELAATECQRNGIKGLVLDPWNEFADNRPKHLTETEYVSQALRQIRVWAREYNVHVWLVAHPRKLKTEQGVDAMPGLGDISGSNNFRNKADYGVTVYRNQQEGDADESNLVTVKITKSRWRDSAKMGGEAHFIYKPETNRIHEPMRGEW